MASAQSNLGAMPRNGQGIPADPTAAAHWFWQAAEADLPIAMSNLAALLLDGIGIARDEAAAIRLYGRTAELGDPEAHAVLGAYHEDERGVPRLRVTAQRASAWMRLQRTAAADPRGFRALG